MSLELSLNSCINLGAGKSCILNSLAGECLFRSGINLGKGLTYQLDEVINEKGHFLDTPGLADESLRKKAGEAISTLQIITATVQLLYSQKTVMQI